MFCTFIIPSLGRPTLLRAVESVLKQDFTSDTYQIVVVNDSGKDLQPSFLPHSERISVVNTNKRERSFSRNVGAALAKGKYLWFLDDDDWILPEALNNFWNLANQEPRAIWLYGGIQIVDEHERILGEINSGFQGNSFAKIMGGAWAPLQASIIQAQAFFEMGGFSPFVCGTEDEDLCRRTAYFGEFANTPEVVACLFRGQAWNTSTNYLRAPDDTKYSRDLILSKPGAFTRLRDSADSNYWHGRILRVYLSTISWNVQKKHFFVALSRFLYSMALLGLSVHRLFSPGYWAGVMADHVPETLHFVMKEYERRTLLS